MASSLTSRLKDLKRWLTPSSQPGIAPALAWRTATREALLLSVLAVAFTRWLLPDDPFGLHQDFPWIWIVPALLAMRYGTVTSVTSVVVFLMFWLLLARGGWIASGQEFPKEFFLGGLALSLICGQFSDIWTARTRRLRAVNAYLDERLQTLTKNHFLLRLSHERLEQDLLAKPLTLRETLARVRLLTAPQGQIQHLLQERTQVQTVAQRLPGAPEFLQLLGQSCQLEIAAIYAVDNAGIATVNEPVAVLGAPSPLETEDALYVYCMAEGRLAHVQTAEITQADRSASRYVICAPLIPSRGESAGMLVVEKLPFFALNDDSLQLLSVLIGYFADGVQMGRVAGRLLEAIPDCPPEMALDIMRLHRIRIEAGIESSAVALVFANDDTSLDLYAQVKRLRRGVDLSWELRGPRHRALITLLPLAGTAAVDGYLLRIEQAVQAQSGCGGFAANGVAIHSVQLGQIDPVDTLFGLVRRCAL